MQVVILGIRCGTDSIKRSKCIQGDPVPLNPTGSSIKMCLLVLVISPTRLKGQAAVTSNIQRARFFRGA